MGVIRDEQDAADRISRVLRHAAQILGSSRKAIDWMDEDNAALDGRKPALMVAESADGLDRVMTILGRIDHGVYE